MIKIIPHKQFINKLTNHVNSVCGETYCDEDIEVIFGSSLFFIISNCLLDKEGVETEIGDFILDKSDNNNPKLIIKASDDIVKFLQYNHDQFVEL